MPFGYKIISNKKIEAMEKQIKASDGSQEGQRKDVLTSGVAGVSFSTNDATMDSNNYATYTTQVETINEMYNSRTNYGGELLRTVLDTRVSFIGGSGLSVIAEKAKTAEFITKFLEYNRLQEGSQLLENILTGEMEGKDLMLMKPEENTIKVRNYSYYVSPYEIEVKNNDNKEISKIVLNKDDKKGINSGNLIAPLDKSVYVKLGGSPDRINRTPPKISNILTHIVNLSRAIYDIRKNNHLFAKVTAYFKTMTGTDAKALNASINSQDFQIGKSFAGTADYSLVEPSGRAVEALIKEIVFLARIISTNTGIPIHWLAFPDLLSNRATAENMLEMINASTIQERMKWEEGFTDLVRKAMVIATDRGMEGAVNDPFGFKIKLPLISHALLKQLQETWIPLFEGDFISKQTVMNQIPSINPTQEKKFIEKEKKANMENMPSVFKEKEPINKEVEDDESDNSEKDETES